MPTPKTKSEVVQDFRIQTIQEAATRVIAREGLAATTMQLIADEAGVAKGTIYLYFRDRRDLVERTAGNAFSQLLDGLDGVFESNAPFRNRLIALIEGLFEFFTKNRDFFRLYLSVRHPSGEVEDENRHHRQRLPEYQTYLDKLESFIRKAMERGEVRGMDPSRLVLFLAEGINGVLLRRLQEPEEARVETDLEWIATTILDGISTSGANDSDHFEEEQL